MNYSRNTSLALFSAVAVGLVNIISMGLVYVIFDKTHTPVQSEFVTLGSEGVIAADSTDGLSGGDIVVIGDTTDSGESAGSGTTGTTNEDGTTTTTNSGTASGNTGSGTSTGTGSSGSTGTTSGSTGSSGAASSSSGSTSSGSTGGGASTPSTPTPTPSTPTPAPTTPDSLKKGSPCTTQTPPAGVCAAVLSFNSQKTGNPNWDANVMADIRQGVADNGFVKALGLNPDDIFNSMKITLDEGSWNGNATHGTIGGKMGAAGQSENTTFTLNWNGSKWMVTGVTQG